MLARIDLALQREGRRAQRKWESAIRSRVNDRQYGGAYTWQFAFAEPCRVGSGTAANGMFAANGSPLRDLANDIRRAFAEIRIPRLAVSAPAIRRWAFVAAGTSAAGVAIAATAISKGYIDHPESFWEARIAERKQSPILGRDDTLIGSVGAKHGTLSVEQAREYAFIPLQGEIPGTYVQALLRMEQKNFFSKGMHNVCGLDVATLKRWLVNPGSGGSTISMQLARQLKQPDWGREATLLQKIWRKGMEIGASCRLYRMLARQGGEISVLRMYASYAPTFQGNGTLRGIEAASRIVFDVAPNDLTDAQQLILAAASRKPLTLLPPESNEIDCRRVYPPQDNARYEAHTSRAHPARSVQCQVLHRAIYRAPEVLEGERLAAALGDLREYQAKGIHPVNPFEPIAARKLVNLASRTASAMPGGLLEQIREEADGESLETGAPLHVNLDSVRQHEFQQAMLGTLEEIQSTPYMKRTLCLPLVKQTEKSQFVSSCATNADGNVAQVLAVNVDVVTGGMKTLYASTPLLMSSKQSIGSLAKWIVVVAALAEGYRVGDVLCPKSARDGDRQLKRTAAPEHGFESCDQGRHLMTLKHATATSDNLAYYGLAQRLGRQRLVAAADALGLGEPESSDRIAYEVSFGAYGARPREVLAALQALVSRAYGIDIRGGAPRALRNANAAENPRLDALDELLPTQEQRDDLRQLLEAPVKSPRGTLGFLREFTTAGKTGTVQSAVKGSNGRLYNHGKWAATYQHDAATLSLFMVVSPLPTVPLAQHDIGAAALMPAHLHLLRQE